MSSPGPDGVSGNGRSEATGPRSLGEGQDDRVALLFAELTADDDMYEFRRLLVATVPHD